MLFIAYKNISMGFKVDVQIGNAKVFRSKSLDRSKWVSDLKKLPVMQNDEIPASQLDFANKESCNKVLQRFQKSPSLSPTK